MFSIEPRPGIQYLWRGDEDDGRLELTLKDGPIGHVEVFFQKEDRFAEGKGPRVEVGWSAIGSVCINEADQFRALLEEGVRIAGGIALVYTKK